MKAPWIFRLTTNKRYLYYTDNRSTRRQKEGDSFVTRVWDRIAGREVVAMPSVIPVDPGPGDSTMVLALADDGRHRPKERSLLHDASSGKLWALM